MTRRRSMFGIKDLFTMINLLGGIVAVCLCIDGRPFEAGISVFVGYLCGDTMDGWIARKLGTSNQFGAEFDTISDHMSHVIAPAFIVYTVYKDVALLPVPWLNQVLAIALAASLIVAVSIRHARNIVAPVEYKGVWAGLPRSVVGFWAIGYVNAATAPALPGGWWIGVVLIPAMGAATLTYLPFPNHRPQRLHRWYVRFSIAFFFVALAAGIILWPQYLFDMVFVLMTIYAFGGWLAFSRTELADYRRVVAAVKARA